MGQLHKGRIVEISKYAESISFIKQGVTKDQQYMYENRYPGGNGTYVTGGKYIGTHLNVKIFVYDDDRSYNFDVYDDVKRIKGVKRISAKLLAHIESHKGAKVNVIEDSSGKYSFDVKQIL